MRDEAPAANGSKGPAQPNRSLVGGLDCLAYLASVGRPVGSREAARELGLEPTRANRLLGTLAWMGLAERTADRKYTPGAGLHVLAAMSLRGSRLLGAAVPHLGRLGERFADCSVALGVLWRRHVVYLYFAGPGEDARVAVASRDLFPAEQSSIGRVLLARMNDAEIRDLYAGGETGLPEGLLDEINEIRDRDWALVNERTLGVALGDPPFAGLAIAGPGMAGETETRVAVLRETAAAIAREVG